MHTVHPLRVLIKSLLLFTIANLALAYFNPTFGGFSIFNHLVKGRVRLPAQRQLHDPFNQGILSFQDMGALFASHLIARSKPQGEYRVVLLGDSSIWGWTLQPPDILSEQINQMKLVTCAGKAVKVYDLAYPSPSYIRDLLILDQALRYQPDLVVWPLTIATLISNKSDQEIWGFQSDRVLQLVERYRLVVPRASQLHAHGFFEHTILYQRSRIKVVIADQLYGLLWAATGLDAGFPPPNPPLNDLAADSEFATFQSPAERGLLVKSFQFSALETGRSLAGNVPILFFNEPIFIANGLNSSIRYNKDYPRWAYDEYRLSMGDWMKEQQLPYEDFWNAIPPSEFTDPELHLTPQGEHLLANRLAPEIQNMACP